VKTLRGTEVDRHISHGHELQGVDDFRVFLGSPAEKKKIRVTYIWLADDDEEPLRVSAEGTWYDSRKNKTHRTSEYRLYYPPTAEEVIYKAAAGDTLFLGQTNDGLMAIETSGNRARARSIHARISLRRNEEKQYPAFPAMSGREAGSESRGREVPIATIVPVLYQYPLCRTSSCYALRDQQRQATRCSAVLPATRPSIPAVVK